jgi:hypothetical protein
MTLRDPYAWQRTLNEVPRNHEDGGTSCLARCQRAGPVVARCEFHTITFVVAFDFERFLLAFCRF